MKTEKSRILLKNEVKSHLYVQYLHCVLIMKDREEFLVEVCAFAPSLSC